MEGLSPALKCLIELQAALQNGEAIRAGLIRFVQTANDEFVADVRRFLFDWDQGRDWRKAVAEIRSSHRRALLELAASGLAGQSIQGPLDELRLEIESACTGEIRERVEMLPLRMLFPLLLFLFPSYLLLLFGPLLSHFVRELGR